MDARIYFYFQRILYFISQTFHLSMHFVCIVIVILTTFLFLIFLFTSFPMQFIESFSIIVINLIILNIETRIKIVKDVSIDIILLVCLSTHSTNTYVHTYIYVYINVSCERHKKYISFLMNVKKYKSKKEISPKASIPRILLSFLSLSLYFYSSSCMSFNAMSRETAVDEI